RCLSHYTVIAVSGAPSVVGQQPADLVGLGRIAGAYGVRGWIRIHSHAQQGNTLLSATNWWIRTPASVSGAGVFRPLVISRARTHGKYLVARAHGIDNREDAQLLKGHTVWVSRSLFPQAEPDEYYWTDLIGCQ